MANHNNDNIDIMLTISEVAQLFNVHINTVRRWSKHRILKSYRIGSRGDRRLKSRTLIVEFATIYDMGVSSLGARYNVV